MSAVASLCCASSALAATIPVNTTTDESGDGAHCSLRDAIAAANSDSAHGGCPAGAGTDTVLLPSGDYDLAGGQLAVTSSMNLTGAGAASTTIKGNRLVRLFEIGTSGGASINVAISGLTLTGGQAPNGPAGAFAGAGTAGANGGAILNHSAALSVTDSHLSDNHAGAGGAGGDGYEIPQINVHQPNGGNGAVGGSGGAIYSETPLTLTNDTLTNNTAGAGGKGGNGLNSGANGTGGAGGYGGDGGAIYSQQSLTLTNDVLGGNSGAGNAAGTGGSVGAGGGNPGGAGGEGGAIRASGWLAASNSTLSYNAAGSGGSGGGAGGAGGAIRSVGSDTLSNSTLSNNVAGGGGSGGGSGGSGGAVYGTAVTVTNGTLSSNRAGSGANGFGSGGAGGAGGAIYSASSIGVSNSTLSGNAAGASGSGAGFAAIGGAGGAIRATGGGTSVLTNDTLTATPAGGGAAASFGGSSTLTVTNTTVAANAGRGIEQTAGSVVLTNSLLTSNAGNCAGTITDGHHNLSYPASDTSCPADTHGDPKLASLHDNGGLTQTFALQPGSAAIDQVPTAMACPISDQRGLPRPQGSACDIGAFEFATPVAAIRSPGNGVSYTQGSTVSSSFACTEGNGTTTVASCDGPVPSGSPIDTSTPGRKSFTVVATDKAGNQASATATYTVVPPPPKASTANSSAPAGSGFVTPPPPPPLAPALTGLWQSHLKWSAAKRSHKHSLPVGTSFSVTLNEPASLVLTFTQIATGRKVHGRCVPSVRQNRKMPACQLRLTVGRMLENVNAGTSKIAFTGHLGAKKLAPGTYLVIVTASDGSGRTSSPQSLSFVLLPG